MINVQRYTLVFPFFKRTFVTTTDADMFDISDKKYAFEWLEYSLYSKNTNQSIIK